MELFGFEKPSLIRSLETSRVYREREFPSETNGAPRPSVQRVTRRKAGAGSLVVRQGPNPNGPAPEEHEDKTKLILTLLGGLVVIAGLLSLLGGDDTVETIDEVATSPVVDEPSEDEVDEAESTEEETLSGLQRAVERVSTEGAIRSEATAESTTTTTAVASNVPVTSPQSTDSVSNVPLEASFVAENGEEGAEQTVGFRSTSVGDISSVTWDFGDGSTGSGPVTFHTYGNPGSYMVTMTAQGGGSTDVVTQEVLVAAISGRVEANFAATAPDATRGQTISFANTSHPSFESFFWDFGDGNTSTERTPTHSYGRAGDFAVLLTATTADGQTDATTYSIRVAANSGNVDAGFSAFPSDSPNQQTMNFQSTSDGDISRFDWTYGDGNLGAGPNPDHSYAAPGRYTVTLRVRDRNGNTDSVSQEIIVERNG